MIKEKAKRLMGSKLAGNFFWMSGMQAANYLLPLITIPYLIRVVGEANFGALNIALAIVGYLVVLTDYGFNITATQEVSLNRTNPKKLSEIFTHVIFTKLVLAAVGFLLLLLVVQIPVFKSEQVVILLTFGMVVGNALFPIWFFQGMENMRFITIFNMGARLLYTILIFTLIKEAADYKIVPLLNSLAAILAGAVAFLFVFLRYKLKLIRLDFSIIKNYFKHGWNVFISSFAVSLYINNNIVILGLFGTKEQVGYYAIAEKLLMVGRQAMNIVFQVIYPRTVKLITDNFIKAKVFLQNWTKYIAVIGVGIGIGLFAFARPITIIFAGSDNSEIILLLRMLAFVPLIVGLNIPIFQLMLARNMASAYRPLLLGGAALNIVLNFALAPLLFQNGTAIALIITEIFITAGLYLILNKKYHNWWIW